MKRIEIVRFISSVDGGARGTDTAALNLIYTYYLQVYGLDLYEFIFIHQIDNKLEEFVAIKKDNSVHVNIRFPGRADYNSLTFAESSIINLQIVHDGLIRLADKDARIRVETLEKIKKEILEKKFLVELPFQKWTNKDGSLLATLVIVPQQKWFDYYIYLEGKENVAKKYMVLRGKPNPYYFTYLFEKSKWKNNDKFVVKDETNSLEIELSFQNEIMSFINKTNFSILRHLLPDAVFVDDGNLYYEKWVESLPKMEVPK